LSFSVSGGKPNTEGGYGTFEKDERNSFAKGKEKNLSLEKGILLGEEKGGSKIKKGRW